MGIFGRSRISEVEAVNKVLGESIDHTVNNLGPQIIENAGPLLKEIFPEFPAMFLKGGVNMCFVTTVLVLESRALPNLFPPEQAARLRAFTIRILEALEKRNGGKLNVSEYFSQVESGLSSALASGTSIVDEIGEIVFDEIELARTLEFAGELQRDPLAVKVLGSACIGLASGRWKQLVSKYRLA